MNDLRERVVRAIAAVGGSSAVNGEVFINVAEAADAAIAAGVGAVPEGWRLVPVKATDPQYEAGCAEIDTWTDPTDGGAILAVYEAMIAKAPTPPAVAEEG
jgi:hypothetical protein